jgi:large subunit ribosomal protein L6
MSRIGKLPIPVPEGVEVALETGNRLSVTGSRGTLQRTFAPSMLINVETGTITIDRPSNARIHRSLHGLTRTLVANMVQGVSGGFTRDLDLVGVGFRGDLILTLGYSHPIRYTPPEGINIEVPVPTQISISGSDKEVVGQVAAKIRSFRKPEPYKGKGILYRGEKLRRKAGKSGKAGKTK